MSKRGENINHKIVLTFNILSLLFILSYILLNNTDIRVFYLLLGFSPAVVAIAINASISKKSKEGYAYFSIPFLTTTLFIILGSLSLNTLTKKMDLETLTVINFLYTFFFAFLYYMATMSINKQTKTKHKKNVKKETKPDPEPSESHKETKPVHLEHPKPKEHVKHVIQKVHVPHYIPVKIEEKEKPIIKPYIQELKKEFNIINIDSESIINSLRELISEHNSVDIHLILDKLEKNKIFFSSNTGEKYHKPLCIVMNHINHDKILAFKNKEEAELEGFKPCRVCMPK